MLAKKTQAIEKVEDKKNVISLIFLYYLFILILFYSIYFSNYTENSICYLNITRTQTNVLTPLSAVNI